MSSWGASEQGWRKGPWTPEEDKLLIEYVNQHGEGRWSCVSKLSGLKRSGKSCRLRWVNYLRPGLKKGNITPQEEGIIIELHALWGNKWSTIARYLPGRTDNEIKNYWRTHFKKRSSKSRQENKRKHTVHHQIQNQEDGVGFNNVGNIEEGFSDHASSCDDHHRDRSTSKQETGPNMDYGTNNHHQFLPMFYYQDIYGGYSDNESSDFVLVDSNLWGGLWT